MAFDSKAKNLRTLQQEALQGGGPEAIDKQHAKGKQTARERVAQLLDEGSFQEIGALVKSASPEVAAKAKLGDGVVTGYGTIDGRPVCVFAQDFTVMGGSLGAAHAAKIAKTQDMALKLGCPLIGINDSGGARIQEGVQALAGYGDIFYRNVKASGVIPQISVILGPCAGGAVYSPAMTDFTFMVQGVSKMFITGPQVVKTVMHEDITADALGGTDVHATTSGVAHFAAADEAECLAQVRKLIGYLPSNNMEDAPALRPTDNPARADESLDSVIPDDPNAPYDMQAVLDAVLDADSFMQVQAGFAPNVVIGFGRLDGMVVGVVANQPNQMAGVLDINASTKAARFVRTCDAFNIPLVTFVDVPGFMPGMAQEHGGIIRHGAKLVYAYCEASVPKLSVVTRKAYGGAYIVMSSKTVGGDCNLAWPTAEIAVMGAEGAVNILHRKEVAAAPDPEAARLRLTADYIEKFANPYVAAAEGFIDTVIEPSQTRAALINALQMLQNKRETGAPKKHGNTPL